LQELCKSLSAVLGDKWGGDDDLAFENMQARLRGVFLMTIANRNQALLLATSNKSESATGYSTLYGDQCGGFAPLGDLYKTDIYALSRWLNHNNPNGNDMVIPQSILDKEPSAELRAHQKDQDSLPPYDVLDKILHALIEENMSVHDIQNRGFNENIVSETSRMLERSEYKRRQAPPAVKLSERALTTERRYPLTTYFYRGKK
jgi:NAD+ synthase